MGATANLTSQGAEALWMCFAYVPLHVGDSQADGDSSELSLCFYITDIPGNFFCMDDPCLHFEVDPDFFLLLKKIFY